ncbi:MAG: aminodeoxychorismate lyase [Pseudomonadota bacterium]
MSEWWCNGVAAARPTPDERGLAYGDGLFETIAIRRGRPRLLRWHLERLQGGAMRLGLPRTDSGALAAEIDACLERAGRPATAVLKLLLTAGSGPRGYARRGGVEATRWLRVWPLEAPPETGAVELAPVPLRLSRQSTLAGIKHLNRLENVLAQPLRTDGGYTAGLLLDTRDLCVCGTMANVFFVLDARLVTPALTHAGIAGVMRRAVLAAAAEEPAMGPVAVRDIPYAEAVRADAAFLTNSQFGLRAVARLGGRDLDTQHPLVATARRRLADAGIEECGRC